jgi:hypothetical protein
MAMTPKETPNEPASKQVNIGDLTTRDGTPVGADGLPVKPGASATMLEVGPTNKSEAPLIVTPPHGEEGKRNSSKELEMIKKDTENQTDEQKKASAQPVKDMKDMKQAPSAGEMTAENEPPDQYPPEPSVLDAGGTPVRASVKAKEDAEAQWTPESPAEGAWKDKDKNKKDKDDDDDDDDDPTKTDRAKSAQATTAAAKRDNRK